jgi:hypothetical protein
LRKASGRGGRIRTVDLLNPIQVRYRTALRPDAAYAPKSIARENPSERRALAFPYDLPGASSEAQSRSIRYSGEVTERRGRDLLALAALSLAALVLGHDLIFLLNYGLDFGAAMQRTGHGAPWLVTVITAATVAGTMTTLAARRLVALSRLAREVEGGNVRGRGASLSDLGRQILRLWAPILVVALALFVANENLERAMVGIRLPGLSVLFGTTHAPTMLVFALVALFVSAFAGLYRWRRDVLAARILAARPRWAEDAPVPLRPRPWADRGRPSIISRRLAGRAPPLSVAATHS